ncbi:MAG: 2Fe-2S iron-sulfur cluster-binding protein [Sphingomonas sp.]
MPRVTFIDHLHTERSVEGDVGQSVMDVARRNGIDGIVGECGGSCACATCHVEIAGEWRQAVGAAGSSEDDLLDFVRERGPGSRLSCQIRLTPALDGLVVFTPARQG